MTPFCQRRPDETTSAWHRRIHETAYDWRDVAELLAMRCLHAESKMVTSVAHLRREERTVALMGVAEERGLEAETALWDEHRRHGETPPVPCGRLCVLVNQGPCGCEVPAKVAELRKRQRALLWAAEALMRPETAKEQHAYGPDIWTCFGCGRWERGTFPKDWVHVCAGEDVCRACQVEYAGDVLAQAANGPTVDTLKKAAEVCLRDAQDAPHDERRHLKRLADQMTERAGGLARSAAEVRR